jgi:Uma2 family endonuclease
MSTTTVTPVERLVLLHNVSWNTYESLLRDCQDQSGTHFIYDEGELEIMVLSRRHEFPNRALAQVVVLLSEELGIRVSEAGSMTYKREALLKGFEPDSAFYIARAAEIEAKDLDEITPENAPPADLIIEVDVTSMSLPRFPIYAAFSVPEIWRYQNDRVSFYRLELDQYVEIKSSIAFPPLTSQMATVFLEDRKRMDNITWARRVRDWARAQ